MISTKFACTLVLAGLLTGCVAVGPDYKAPDKVLSAEWTAPGANALAGPAEARWWTLFGDQKLDSLVDRAIAANTDLRVATARVQEARELRRAATSGLFPVVDGNASATRRRASENLGPRGQTSRSSNGDKITNNFEGGLDASWELDVFGRVRREVEAATADLEALEENRRDVLVILLGDVAGNYVELRGVQNRLTVVRRNLTTQGETLRLTQTRFDAGLGTRLELARAEAQLAETEAQVPALEYFERQSIHRLGVLVGAEPGSLAEELLPPTAIPAVPATLAIQPPADMLRRRPDIRRAERELAAATARTGVAKGDLYPRFVFGGNLGLATSDLSDLSTGTSRTWAFGPSVSIPLFNAGELRARLRAAGARQEQALARYDQTVLNALEEVENALVLLNTERQRRDALARAVEAYQRASKLSNDLFTQGLIDFFDVLDSDRNLLDSERNLAGVEATLTRAAVSVYKAMGGGWDDVPMESEAQGTEDK